MDRGSTADHGFGIQIRLARDARGWSQEKLAAQAGMSRPSVARIERGDDVSTATLVRVAGALGLAIEIRGEVTH